MHKNFMAKIKIVTDSTSSLPAAYSAQHDIAVVQLTYIFEGESYIEGTPEEWSDFYQRFAVSKDFPKTSQAGIHGFIKAYEQALFQEGYDGVICMVVSGGVSGTYNSAIQAARMVDEQRIQVVDSLGGASSLKMLVERTVARIQKGMSLARLVECAQHDASHMKYQLTAATLDYLQRSGRLSKAMAMLGGALKILPLVELVDGKMEVIERVRGGKGKVVEKMIARMPEKCVCIGVTHVLAYEDAQKIAERLEGMYPGVPIRIDQANPSIGSHLGPGAIGIAALWEE